MNTDRDPGAGEQEGSLEPSRLAIQRARARLVRCAQIRRRYWGELSDDGRRMVHRVMDDECRLLERAGLGRDARRLLAVDGDTEAL